MPQESWLALLPCLFYQMVSIRILEWSCTKVGTQVLSLRQTHCGKISISLAQSDVVERFPKALAIAESKLLCLNKCINLNKIK